jgi:hypothetical protein
VAIRDDDRGTSCRLSAAGISFAGPGETVDTSSEAVRVRDHIRRIELGIDTYTGRASLKLFGHREINAYGDTEQAAELGVEKDTEVRLKLGREVLWTSTQGPGSGRPGPLA